MSKKSKKQPSAKKSPAKKEPKPIEEQPKPGGFHAFRESLESVVIAFVLAFLFRTFEAEAFQIPTGSMSPALLGRHKDVNCSECGYRFRITDSEEESDQVLEAIEFLNSGRLMNKRDRERLIAGVQGAEVLGGVCPMCRHAMPVRPKSLSGRPDFPTQLEDQVTLEGVEAAPSYNGDRILVNKYGFTFNDPERWDVVVFKYPGNAGMNYIKRLVGLPGERLQVYQGDLFARPLDGSAEYKIQRKPPSKVLAMLQPVHDTDFESSTAYEAGWPLRWAATTPQGWEVTAEPGEQTVATSFQIDHSGDADETAWLRYRHLVPDAADWQAIRDIKREGQIEGGNQSVEAWLETIGPELVTDFNPYNAKLSRKDIRDNDYTWEATAANQGLQWVSDLAVRCEVEVKAAQGSLLLDLVEAGKHFRAKIDLSTGAVEFGIVDGETGKKLDFEAKAQTPVNSTGSYTLLFANVDDQLLLWVDGELVEITDSTYDPEELFGERKRLIPWASSEESGDQGDLAPVGIGAAGAQLKISRIEVLRDIYYLASEYPLNSLEDYGSISNSEVIEGRRLPQLGSHRELFSEPKNWFRFLERRRVSFPVDEEQFFVMGDNSPFSQDARLWKGGSRSGDSVPGGAYLDRRLLIGKAVCVFWPHSWGSIPGLRKLPGFPNFSDMRLVR
ncbi:MAG: signal peptidase I [Lacipirellulaceae bacterium]